LHHYAHVYAAHLDTCEHLTDPDMNI
jgi:hypothetical protein